MREPFASIVTVLNESRLDVLSVDIPSGWDVHAGKEVRNAMKEENKRVLFARVFFGWWWYL